MDKFFTFLPMYTIGVGDIKDGLVVKCPVYCRNKKNNKCEEFYKDIFKKPEGLYICPYGFNTYVVRTDLGIDIFTGFRVRNKYNKKKADMKISRFDKNHVIYEEELQNYVDSFKKYHIFQDDYIYLKDFINNTIHDLRKYNAHINHKSNIIISKTEKEKKKKFKSIENLSMNIWAMSTLINNRLNTFDFIYNLNPLKYGEPTITNIFKCFDKMRMCFEDKAKEKGISIRLNCNGECPDIKAYESFELIPFSLIDNCIKYSLNNNNINISIKDSIDEQIIVIESIAPRLYDDEKDKIFIRGFRGKNAKKLTKEGSGIGMYIVNKVCKIHKISLDLWSDKEIIKNTSDIEYSRFYTKLTIDKFWFEKK